MNLIYLKYFYDAAISKSISTSAKLNFVSQSAVSQGIRKIEQTLNKSLITHQRNTFKLTEDGKIALESCKYIFKSIKDLEENLNYKERNISGTLLFGCSHSIALSLLHSPLLKLKKKYPLIQANFRLAHTTAIMNLIEDEIIEFGIVLDNIDLSRFNKIKLYEGNFHLYSSKSYKRSRSLETKFLLTEPQKEIFLLKDAFKKRYKKDISTLMEISSWEIISNFVEKGFGIGFIPDFLVRENNRKDFLKIYELDILSIPYVIYAIYPQNSRLSRKAKVFLSCFQN